MTNRRIWIFDKCWQKATVIDNKAPRSKWKVLLDGCIKPTRIGKKPMYPVKNNDVRRKTQRREIVPPKNIASRPGRCYIPNVRVEAVTFTGPNKIGDYRWQCADEQQVDPAYGRALHVYNENIWQQMDKTDNAPGGGNAIARRHRPDGRSIGMPTGCFEGFTSLQQVCVRTNFQIPSIGVGNSFTAKQVIDAASEEIVMQVCDNPERYDKIYYCTNSADEDLIGMGIFEIESTTRRYITEKIKSLPLAIKKCAIERRRAVRA